ncbi:MAG: hypothetical protein F6K42_11610 [Leptolyngbya sp. SIO1D8]|nr:hypothetical protein [Leptolyngbya sp. SIO1D8]
MKRNHQIWSRWLATLTTGISIGTFAILLGTVASSKSDRFATFTTIVTEEKLNGFLALKGIALNGRLLNNQSPNRLLYNNSDWIQPNMTLATVGEQSVQSIRLEDGQLVFQLEGKVLQPELSQ